MTAAGGGAGAAPLAAHEGARSERVLASESAEPLIRERVPPPGIAVDLRDEPDVGSRWHSFDDQRVEPYDVSNLEADAFGGTYQVDASTLRAVDGEEDDVSPRAGRKRFDRPNSAYMLFYDRVVSRPARAGNEGDANEPEPDGKK